MVQHTEIPSQKGQFDSDQTAQSMNREQYIKFFEEHNKTISLVETNGFYVIMPLVISLQLAIAIYEMGNWEKDKKGLYVGLPIKVVSTA